MLKSVNVNGKSNPGFSSGDAKAVQEVAAQHLQKPILMSSRIDQRRNYSREPSNWGVLLSLIFVYFLLSAQYESYLVPLSILLSLPVGVAGAIGFVYLSGLENNIYFRSL
jgi:HAE1 family hydrophobic/amphiphilic exporter-1